MLIVLGINKQLDFQTLLTEIGRKIAHAQGWYEQRQEVQVIFVSLLMLIGAAGLLTFTLKSTKAGVALLTKTVGGGITIPVGTDGIATIAISLADRAALTAGFFFFDVVRTDAGSEDVLASGRIRLLNSPSVP